LTKQSNIAPTEKQNEDLLLRRFKLMDEFVQDLRQQNIKAGVDSAKGVMKQFIPWSDFVQRKIKYQGWLDTVTNPNKPGKFYTIKDLKRTEDLPEDTISEHEGKSYPYRKLNALYKIKDKRGRLYLLRHEDWYGLDSAGEERMISVNDLDYWVKVNVRKERIPKDPKILVSSIVDNKRLDPLGEKVWLTPYSRERVDEFLTYSIPNEGEEESKAGTRSGTSLILQKEGQHGTTVSYEDFIAEDFDGTLKRANQPAPTFKVDKDFMKRLGSAGENDPNVTAAPYK
jgi:hypothetical protein